MPTSKAPSKKPGPASLAASKAVDRCDVLLTGTGSLARAILLSWPPAGRDPLRQQVIILGRSEARASELAALATLRAAAAGFELECAGASTTWMEDDLRQLLAKHRPRLILHTASLQSPWAKSDETSRWRGAIRQFGYGLTTVLHSVLALRVGRAAGGASPDSALVNCCYPDAVNPVLTQAGVPVVCGGGNVAIVAAVWRSLSPSRSPVRILAHHAHLVQLFRPGSGAYPRVWIGKLECDRVPEILANVRLPADDTLNAVTGTVIANLAQALLGRQPVHTHAPAPLGLAGGYPVLAGSGRVTLDLPAGLDQAQAAAFIETAQVAEGIDSIGKHGLRYTKALADELRRQRSKFPSGFAPNEIEAAGQDMLSLRKRLGGSTP